METQEISRDRPQPLLHTFTMCPPHLYSAAASICMRMGRMGEDGEQAAKLSNR